MARPHDGQPSRKMAVGYSTLYGDMSGRPRGPGGRSEDARVRGRPPREPAPRRDPRGGLYEAAERGAEARPDGPDTLPPYEVLDGILRLWVEELRSIREIVAAGYDETVVRDVVAASTAASTSASRPARSTHHDQAFGLGRRMRRCPALLRAITPRPIWPARRRELPGWGRGERDRACARCVLE